MRFEVGAAYALGILLPVLEVLRRGAHVVSIASYVDDFLVGGLLLIAARTVSAGRAWGPPLLIAAWAVLCGGLYYSFFGQLERGAGVDASGFPNHVVVAIKGALYIIALVSLVRAMRAARVDDV